MRRALILLAILAFAILSGHRLDAPWSPGGNGDEAYAGAQYHAICRHFLRHGIWRTRGAQFRIFHDLRSEEIGDDEGCFSGQALRKSYGDLFWVSRLPFGSLLHLAALKLAGKDGESINCEWALRLVPFISAILLIAILGLLLQPALGEAGIAIAGVCALMPGTVAWARMPGYELPCLFLSTASLIFYAAHREGWPLLAPAYRFAAAWLCGMAASIIGWFGLLAVAIMLADTFMAKSPDIAWRRRAALALIPALVICLYAFYLYLLDQSFAERLDYFWHQRSLGLSLIHI